MDVKPLFQLLKFVNRMFKNRTFTNVLAGFMNVDGDFYSCFLSMMVLF